MARPVEAFSNVRTQDGPTVMALVFADIEGSTKLLRAVGLERFGILLADHQRLLQEVASSNGGVVANVEGDGTFLTFPSATMAVVACAEAQRRLAVEVPYRVRMAVHVGEVAFVAGEQVGLGIHQAARLVAATHGGQVLLSDEARIAAGDLPHDLGLRHLGAFRLPDHEDDVVLHRLVVEGLEEVGAPPRALPTGGHALPLPRLPCIGRDEDLLDVSSQLECSRLVTLTGPGGVGKTRLAIEVARHLAPSLPDGAWWVDVSAPGVDVGGAVAAAVGLRAGSGAAAREGVALALLARTALIVVDGCEHVLDQVAELADRLLQLPGPRLLLTCRVPTGVVGEALFRVRPLALPPLRSTASEVAGAAAVRLFVDRAARVRLGFEVNPTNGPAVARVCRAAEGMPLSLELAAGRLAFEEVADVWASMSRSPAAPDPAPADGEATTTALSWAWARLGGEARAVQLRLATVPTPLPVAAAVAVAGIPAARARAAIGELVAHSLLEEEIGADGERRLRQLTPVRAEVAARPDLASVAEDAARGLVRWSMTVHERPAGDHRLAADLEVHRAAFAAALELDPPAATRLAVLGAPTLRNLGAVDEGLARLEAAVALGPVAGGASRTDLLLATAQIHVAADRSSTGLEIVRGLLDDPAATLTADERARSELLVGEALLDSDMAAAIVHLRAAAEAARASSNPRLEGRAHASVVRAHIAVGDAAAAGRAFRRAADLFDAAGETQVRVLAPAEVVLAAHLGDVERAQRAARAHLAEAQNEGAWWDVSYVAWLLADLSVAAGDLDTAREAVAHLITVAEREPSMARLVVAHGYAQGIAIDTGRLDDVRVHTERLHALLPLAADLPEVRTAIRFGDLNAAVARGDLVGLRSALARVELSAEELEDAAYVRSRVSVLAPALLILDRPEDALDLVRRARRAPSFDGDHLIDGLLHLYGAMAQAQLGRTDAAVDELAEAFAHGLDLGIGVVVPPALDVCCQLLAEGGDQEAAVRSAAAAAAERRHTGAVADPLADVGITAAREALRAAIGADAFAAAWAAGEAESVKGAAHDALERLRLLCRPVLAPPPLAP